MLFVSPRTRSVALLSLLAALALTLAACGSSSDSTSTSATESSPTSTSSSTTTTDSTTSATTTEAATPATTTTSVSSACSDVETFDVKSAGTHFDRKFAPTDYTTNPPTAGDHNPTPLATGNFYAKPPPLGESVHALEHGAVIGWTNNLSAADTKAVEDAFNAEFSKGYFQIAVVENPDLDGSFAMSSWDSLQRCESIDAKAISDFVENHYASPTTAEASLACTGKAAKLPACVALKNS